MYADLRGLVDGAYGAALDDAQVVPWLGGAVQALGGVGGTLTVMDPESGEVLRQAMANPDPKGLEKYGAEEIWRFDPQIPYVMTLQGSHVFTDIDHSDPDDARARRHADFLDDETGWRHYLTTAAVLGRGRPTLGLSVHRRSGTGATPPAEQAKLHAILPELTRAFAFGVLHSEKLLDAFWEGAASAAKEPALLLDERGRVMRMTRDAERMLARGGLDISAGRLRAAAPVEDAALQAIVGRATHPTAPLSGAARVRRADGRLAAILVAYPIARRNRLIGPADAAALLVMVDPLGQASAAALYQEALGLTWREAEVAALLMAGHSPESASACLGISLATVRVHLRKLLAKSGMSRQADLLRLLARIA